MVTGSVKIFNVLAVIERGFGGPQWRVL